MRNLPVFALLMLVCTLAVAQSLPVEVSPSDNHLVYRTLSYGATVDTQFIDLFLSPDRYRVVERQVSNGPFVAGYATSEQVVVPAADSCFTYTRFVAEEQLFVTPEALSRHDVQFDTAQVDGLTRYGCSINSNRLEFYVREWKRDISPLPYYGRMHGLLVAFWRNGQKQMELVASQRDKHVTVTPTDGQVTCIGRRQLANLKRQRMVVATRVFDSVQLSWGKADSRVDGDVLTQTPYDSILHFAGGTLALKRVVLPVLPAHYQTFLELRQHSAGDAYDRTGSVFVVPVGHRGPTFLDGIFASPDSLPSPIGRDGQKYQGIVRTQYPDGRQYLPPVELMRFFTSFGVNHFNDRVHIDGLQWQSENYYKQEVTDLAPVLQGEVWIGVWIGNYDGGGHRVTLDLKSYPNDILLSDTRTLDVSRVQPLFNTCNVLEMAGQNYGRLFGTDSLTVEFTISDTSRHPRLRYLSTGHGGWDGGDEFNPKPNTLIIDGAPAFIYTPWRCDCARYREWNPVSGNFWNGMSSSDFSRSGWCPGTATQPVYFDLSHLAPGRHTLTVAIPQGAEQEGSFSHWAVSGVIVTE